jgi:hypothetical protein
VGKGVSCYHLCAESEAYEIVALPKCNGISANSLLEPCQLAPATLVASKLSGDPSIINDSGALVDLAVLGLIDYSSVFNTEDTSTSQVESMDETCSRP